ncbi:hypothetical protein LTR56_003579 [Elasticomyces elasticus]|nr:hypothetical protein LTR56_003579 [Elasticomyces elasticus]KAK3663713.1 hypothetical protein LTR22_005414 [Elasticomyces elasticus]KAK4927231.1 hypothetical protein LTR49_005896 [Elasticomyces elasticus]KAK5767363.1 hypothetical protein LTS12_002516 [Elasticomyces elasticus]
MAAANFSARDFELLAGAMNCTKTPIEIDYKKFAEMFEYKNANSSKAVWHGLKKKLEKMSAAGEGASGETKEKGGVKRKATDDDAEESGDESPVKKTAKSPAAKKGRKAPAKGKGTVEADEDGEEEVVDEIVKKEDAAEVEPEVKKTRAPAGRGRKGKAAAAAADEEAADEVAKEDGAADEDGVVEEPKTKTPAKKGRKAPAAKGKGKGKAATVADTNEEGEEVEDAGDEIKVKGFVAIYGEPEGEEGVAGGDEQVAVESVEKEIVQDRVSEESADAKPAAKEGGKAAPKKGRKAPAVKYKGKGKGKAATPVATEEVGSEAEEEIVVGGEIKAEQTEKSAADVDGGPVE